MAFERFAGGEAGRRRDPLAVDDDDDLDLDFHEPTRTPLLLRLTRETVATCGRATVDAF